MGSGHGEEQGPQGSVPVRALRVSHSGVVDAWREREVELGRAGIDVTLVTASSWDELGRRLDCEPRPGEAVVGVRTWGRHPALFVYDPRPIWKLLRHRPGFDVVDAHEEPYSLAVAEVRLLRWLSGRSRRAPLLLYSAQNISKRYPWPIRRLERGALRTAAAVYPCSTGAAEVLRQKGYRGVVRVIPLGVDVDRFTPGPVTADDDVVRPGLRMAYAGRLVAEKGVDVVLQAMAAEPGWHLDVLGTGPQQDGLQARAAELGVAARVTFRGAVSQDDLPDAYRRADVLVVPSLLTPAWTEQFCRVAVEAMACGVPVVASAVGSLPEVVADGGILVPPGDPDALREALRGLADDDGLRRKLGAAGRDRVRGWASWPAVAAEHAGLYREVLG
ncbi:MAG: hypothetical protein QOE93_1608 [Actinomycetota bacterium]|jgi:glycosyltransferase involved in cell wall biosynthesis|nr:hypothetical protein [Actinomycetota bacterium]